MQKFIEAMRVFSMDVVNVDEYVGAVWNKIKPWQELY
jgi:hypothetical protein